MFREFLLRNWGSVKVVCLEVVFRVGQHLSVGVGQLVTNRVSTLAITCAVRNFTPFFVCLDIFHVGFDVDAVAADYPVQSTVSNVFFRLAVALDYWREDCSLFRPLNAGVNQLRDPGGFRGLDYISVLLHTLCGFVHARNQKHAVHIVQRFR